MRLLKNNKGYALLLSFVVIIIFAILGLSLMIITTNGITKNNSREDTVQATDLADKGIDYVVNDIQKFLENEIKTKNYGKDDFYNLLEITLKDPKYNCSKGITIPAVNSSKTTVCIKEIEMLSTDEKDRYKRLVTFDSTGLVEGKEKTITSKVIIGTDAVPDQLKYAISTNDNGNLYLHGGVDIQGDIKTDGNLIISPKATWQSTDWRGYTTNHWEDSVTAKIKKDVTSSTPKLIMNEDKNVYLLKTFKSDFYNSHINGNELNKSNYYDKYSPTIANASSIISSKFFNSPNLKIVTKELPDDKIEVEKKVEEMYKKTNATYEYLKITNNNNNTNNPLKSLNKNTEVFIGEEEYCVKKDRKGNCIEKGKRMKSTYLNINGNGSSINLSGKIFLKGDLTIHNTQLKSDALLFVDGNVEIKDSTLNGINNDSTLIIFASGDICISNISVDKETPSVIKGFFYTKQDMIMYGVGSNIQLYGGISAKRLILTAVRGNANNSNYESSSKQAELYDHDKNPNTPEVPKRNSRLTIVYDQNLISEYTSFKRDEEEEFITELNDPEIISREN